MLRLFLKICKWLVFKLEATDDEETESVSEDVQTPQGGEAHEAFFDSGSEFSGSQNCEESDDA